MQFKSFQIFFEQFCVGGGNLGTIILSRRRFLLGNSFHHNFLSCTLLPIHCQENNLLPTLLGKHAVANAVRNTFCWEYTLLPTLVGIQALAYTLRNTCCCLHSQECTLLPTLVGIQALVYTLRNTCCCLYSQEYMLFPTLLGMHAVTYTLRNTWYCLHCNNVICCLNSLEQQ